MSNYMNTYNYDSLPEEQKKRLISQMYIDQKMSLGDIATKLNTYPNKIRRDAKKYHIKLRDKSHAQKNALKTGKHKHPTKGTKRDADTASKIGIGVMQNWAQLSDDEKLKRVQKSKKIWDSMSDEQKTYMQKLAIDAVRKTSKEGSKLEKFILHGLLSNGYKVDFHKEQLLSNTKLQLDIFLPASNIAIEIDGPSHFAPVWGDQALARNQDYDQKKSGLLTGKGIKLIRIKQEHDFSNTRAKMVLDKILSSIQTISSSGTNFIEIGD